MLKEPEAPYGSAAAVAAATGTPAENKVAALKRASSGVSSLAPVKGRNQRLHGVEGFGPKAGRAILSQRLRFQYRGDYGDCNDGAVTMKTRRFRSAPWRRSSK